MLTAEALNIIMHAAAQHRDPIKTADGGHLVFLPQGFKTEVVPPLVPPLKPFIRQEAIMHTPQAFSDYVNAFKNMDSRIFAEPGFLAVGGKARVLVALDYHEGSTLDADGLVAHPPAPGRVSHSVLYTPRYSEAWERWVEACSGKVFTQGEFAEFIEETRQDIVEPAAATLLDVVRMFKASKKQDFDSFMHEQSGSVKLHFSSEVQQQGSVTLPEMMKIGIPVYYRTDRVEMDVFIRFRLVGGKVVFFMKLDRPDRVEEHAFDDLTSQIQVATQVPLHNGRI